MAPFTAAIEIARPPEEVFAYLGDLTKLGEWQTAIEQITVETEGPTRVGTRALERRRSPAGSQQYRYEITEYDPPRQYRFRGIDGPVRPVGTVTVSSAAAGKSLVTIELDFEGHGPGKLVAPLARRDARKSLPLDQQRLKQRLESGASS